jgi:hypothetical protein
VYLCLFVRVSLLIYLRSDKPASPASRFVQNVCDDDDDDDDGDDDE